MLGGAVGGGCEGVGCWERVMSVWYYVCGDVVLGYICLPVIEAANTQGCRSGSGRGCVMWDRGNVVWSVSVSVSIAALRVAVMSVVPSMGTMLQAWWRKRRVEWGTMLAWCQVVERVESGQ